MEEDGQTTPFWLQNTTTHFHPSKNRYSSICFNTGVLLIVLLSIGAAAIAIFFFIPSLLSFTSQVFRPNLVKKSWDSLNFVLVLFAIFCGILGRKKDDDDDDGNATNVTQVPEEPPVQQEWFGYSDQGMMDMSNSNTIRRLKRNSSSYPDLRQESSWAVPDENWRFYDDSHVYNQRLESNYFHRPRHGQGSQDGEAVYDSGIKTIPVDTYVINRQASSSSPLPPASPAPAPPSPPPPPQLPRRRRRSPSEMKHKARRTFQSVAKQDKTEIKEMEFEKDESLSPTLQRHPSPPQPSPPSDVLKSRTEKKPSKIERKRSSGAKEIASTLASLYNQRKRTKKHRSKENFDDIFPSAPYSHFGPPPPPPPPPPASKFHQLFKIGSKSKRIHSVLVSSPPPPPPLPPLRPTKHKTHRQHSMPQPPPATPPREFSKPRKPTTPGKPPLPSKLNSFYYENLNSGNQSPLVPMPPPPPPPPFKMSGFKFIVRGDYAQLQSNHSSSPDFDSVDTPPTSTPTTNHGREGEAGVSAFCPSPDVNTKADTFIARFRAGLRMEKVKSFKEKQETDTSGSIPNPN